MQTIAGKYEVLEELGAGATGSVYLVRHIKDNVKYALKVLSPYVSANVTALERFKQEAAALAAFRHPGSLCLHDFGQTEVGLYYMTIDFCPGITLRDGIDMVPTLAQKLEIMQQLLAVLDAAHAADIIHRDIKPENIMLLEEEHGLQIKLLDFGVAKLLQDADKGLTVQGMPIGTPQYMAPEIVAGTTASDKRVDIYSAGVVLYELLAGGPPFNDQSIVQTLLLHLSKPPPPFSEELEISEELAAIVFKALEKQPDDRFQSAADFREACLAELARIVEGNNATAAAIEETQKSAVPLHILCLDDDQVLLGIMEHVLATEGYQVSTLTTPSLVPGLLFQRPVDLLISDVMMPGMEGTQVCELLRESVSNVKIILFSNIPDRELERKAKAAGADAWISKNAKPAEWLERIKSVLDQSNA